MDDRRPPHLRPSRSRRRSRSRNGRGGTAGELSVCFPLRRPSWSWGWTSSSMRTPSARSLPSPGRAKDGAGASSITGSLSRRLRSSSSVKGGQSPAIFPSFGGGKKKGAAAGAAGYDGSAAAPAAAEPSSPKVTCIGQVRVKTGRRKQKKKAAAAAAAVAAAAAAGGGGIDGAMALRSRSRREGGGSFRRADSGDHLSASTRGHGGGNCSCCFPRRGQSWVYLPFGAMCEALKALACCFSGWRCGRCWGCSCKDEKAKGGEEKAAGSKRMSWSWCCFRCSASSSCCSGCCTCDGGRRKKGSRRKGKQQQKHKSTAQTGTVCSCTAAFARCWMMEMHVEKGGRREGQGKEEEDVEDEVFAGAMVMERGRSRRGMADLELVADELEKGMWKTVDSTGGGAMGEGEGEIAAAEDIIMAAEPPPPPPPNALLLMRCRSDPVKMAAMATRFVDFPATKLEIQDAEEEENQVTVPHRNGMRKPAPLPSSIGEIIEEERHTAAKEVTGTSRATTTSGGEGGRDQQQGPSSSRPVFEIEETTRKGGAGDWILEKREAKLPPQHPATRPSVAAATEETGTHPLKKVPPLPEEVENRAASLFQAGRERPKPKQVVEENSTRKEEKRRDSNIPRDRDVRNNAPPLKERRSFSRDKDAVPPPVPGGGRRPSFSSSDREDAAAGARRSSSYREGRRSSFSSDGGEARRSSFGADNKGDGKRRWSFSSEKDAKRAETAAGDQQPRGRVRRDQGGGADANGTKCGGALAPGTASAEEANGAELPDCLLLMMYEPKLSMEVSKETWVCTADFVRWRPHQRQQRQQNQHQHGVNGVAAGHEASKSPAAEHAEADEAAEDALLEEDAASASHPDEGAPMTASGVHQSRPHHPPSQGPPLSPSAKWEEAAAAADQKLGSASAVAAAANATASSCGPVTLTRCKSDPVRLSSSPNAMSPEGCFWKSRYMPTATAGIGF